MRIIRNKGLLEEIQSIRNNSEVNLKTIANEKLEDIVVRDDISRFGLLVGGISGLIYGLASNDIEGMDIIHTTARYTFFSSGMGYCLGSVLAPVYNFTREKLNRNQDFS